MPTSAQKRLDDLVRIGESLVWSSSPETITQRTIDILSDVIGCDCLFVHLLDVTGDYLVRYVACGDIPELARYDGRVSTTRGRMVQMLTTHQPIIMDFLYPDPSDEMPDSLIFRSGVSVPLLAGDDMLGMFTILYDKHYHWTEQEIDYLLNIGRLFGIAVQHAQIARKTADLEILLERKRLSGELHDNLSQLVGSLNMNAEAALLSWEEDNTDRLRNDIERIRRTGQEAAQMLRDEMLSLRTPTNETEGLIPGIRESIQRFEQQWGVDTELKLGDDMETIVVSTQMKLQFIRILHESLSNVLRHATASHVSVLFQGDQNRLRMQIHDNGRGFDPDSVSNERLGLRVMRERAESLGGTLTIESGDGTGTTICVEVPWHGQ